MNYKKLVIVGDKFNEFANGKDVLTISQLELLSQIPANIIDKEHEIIIGQGVRKDFAGKVISNQARNVVHGNKLKMCSLEKLVRDKKNAHCHKRLEQNVLIGSAEQTEHNSELFAMPLLIDERCELMAIIRPASIFRGCFWSRQVVRLLSPLPKSLFISRKQDATTSLTAWR